MVARKRRFSDRLAASPLRRLTGKHTVLLEYVAPRSGALVSLPVWAVPWAGGWVVVVGKAEAKTWWKAFRRELPATIVDVRSRHEVVGRLLATDHVYYDALAAYVAAIPAAGRVAKPGVPIVFFRARLPEAPSPLLGRV